MTWSLGDRLRFLGSVARHIRASTTNRCIALARVCCIACTGNIEFVSKTRYEKPRDVHSVVVRVVLRPASDLELLHKRRASRVGVLRHYDTTRAHEHEKATLCPLHLLDEPVADLDVVFALVLGNSAVCTSTSRTTVNTSHSAENAKQPTGALTCWR
jgi:hypothetical protein